MQKKLNFKEDVIEIINQKKSSMGTYSLEINLTDKCNFNCSYCFEGDHTKIRNNFLSKNPDILIKTIYSILNNKWFKLTFRGLKIDFWGGEPTLNIPLLKIITDEFKDNERVNFFIYTNGSRINKILPILKELNKKKCVGNTEKIKVQVSYDGLPLHDIYRLDKQGKPTSTIVRKSFEILHNEGILFNIKATLTYDGIKHMPEVWGDFCDLYYKYGKEIGYSPTLDYFNVIDNQSYVDDLEKSLIDISIKELDFFKKNNRFLLSWFNSGKKLNCGVGRGMSCIDINGKVYYCHGTMSSKNKKDFCFYNIRNKELINNIKDNFYKFKSEININECQTCESTICLRCNIVKYINSQKNNFYDKFYDYTSQPVLCKYYKIIGKIHRALASVIKEEK